ncbi:hypothetical protein BFW86_14240 [Pseudomonas fluorescens]|nr:hypothetical protein BFW86_14240 [Pseudomonas fluorescens]
MSTSLNKLISITDESLSAMEYAHQALKSAEAAFKTLTTVVSEHSDAFHLARMGELFCMDQAGGLDCYHESYTGQFEAVLSESREEVHS